MISIVIPVYNVENYIIRCLQSVTRQKYVKDIECIIVDDCGTDNSMQLAIDFISNYRGDISFRIIRHKVNGGLSAARNTGTRHASASSDWIFYLDSDDELMEECLHKLMVVASRFPSSEMICGNTLLLPDVYAEKWRDLNLKKNLPSHIASNELANKFFFDVKYIQDWIPVNAWNKLINTKFIKENNISFCEGLIHEDELWMFDLLKHIKSIAFCHERTYVHHQTDGSITRSGQEKRSCSHRLAIANWELAHMTPTYRRIQKTKIFFQLADVYERALTVGDGFHREVRREIESIAKNRGVSIPVSFRLWFCIPFSIAKLVGPFVRKILIS
ncbi:MAG: glycosyltransferase family 2 protein [Bacteroidia bacterium]|nr:glycosyltransferase family 2 protein [Bacteroidia bacterium]